MQQISAQTQIDAIREVSLQLQSKEAIRKFLHDAGISPNVNDEGKTSTRQDSHKK